MLSIPWSKSGEWSQAEEQGDSHSVQVPGSNYPSSLVPLHSKPEFCKILWYHYTRDFPFHCISSSWFLSYVYNGSLITAPSLPAFGGSKCVSKEQAFYATCKDFYF